jgi:hypothetical protein
MNETHRTLHFSLLPETFAIVRLAPDAAIPAWATKRPLFSVTRTEEELSILTPASEVPAGFLQQTDWRILKLRGPFELSEVGVLAAVTGPLAKAGVSIFVISTFDTDYLSVQTKQLRAAILALETAGHVIERGLPAVPGI